jgi:hypothetical protein
MGLAGHLHGLRDDEIRTSYRLPASGVRPAGSSAKTGTEIGTEDRGRGEGGEGD